MFNLGDVQSEKIAPGNRHSLPHSAAVSQSTYDRRKELAFDIKYGNECDILVKQ